MNKTIKTILKIGVFVGAVVGTMYAINRYIEKAAVTLNKLKSNKENYYKWSLGNVYYEKSGEGSPILLLHDFTPYASSYEWTALINKLAADHTVYSVDLLGCGRSDKPAITYTNFMYVQMVTDFINDVIKEKTDIITSGYSSSIALMSTNYTCENIGKLILINPADFKNADKELSISSRLTKIILETPVIGTFLYNMFTLRKNIDSIIKEEYFLNQIDQHEDIVDTYYEAAHYKNSNGKYVMSGILGNSMEANIPHALKSCKNDILILGGQNQERMEDIIEDYKEIKPEIESFIINGTKKLPHFEMPEKILELI